MTTCAKAIVATFKFAVYSLPSIPKMLHHTVISGKVVVAKMWYRSLLYAERATILIYND